ncbi:MAG: trypsin-like peptidase domain-containing protein [Gammaproteobacteria bacterium]|nr:trypsin-like peptidase domain-containing protein [Gammaproteobacteria bacterium]
MNVDSNGNTLMAAKPFCKGNWRIYGIILFILIIFTFFAGFYLLDRYHFDEDDSRYVIPMLNMVPDDVIPDAVPVAFNGMNVAQNTGVQLNQLASHVLPAVVAVTNANDQIIASGVIVSPRGHFVTAWHAISPAQTVNIKVRTNQGFNVYTADVLRIQPEHDMVLLKINTQDKFLYMSIPTAEELVVNQVASFGIGSAGEIIHKAGSLSNQPVSLVVANRQFNNLLKTDSVYSWQQTGGPVVDKRAQLVGINLAIKNSQGTIDGYVVPSQFIRKHFSGLIPKNKKKI